MKYFLDTEFHESKKPVKMLGITLKEIRTIDLISIGIFCEDGREYYAINKDCDIKAIWNDKWLRENVLKSIHAELSSKEGMFCKTYHWNLIEFSLKGMKNLIKWHGRSLPTIANDIATFIYGDDCGGSGMSAIEMAMKYEISDKSKEPEFYAYYADYDWVVFCWIFGRMIELPKGFPMYCRDLKQIFDEKNQSLKKLGVSNELLNIDFTHETLDIYNQYFLMYENHKKYPKQTNEHNALADAKWNYDLYKFLTHEKVNS